MNLIIKEEQKYKREYLYENETGDARVVVYELYPGIEVAIAGKDASNRKRTASSSI